MLAQALKVGHSPRYLRPLPASRRRHLRAEILADVAAVKKVRVPNCIRQLVIVRSCFGVKIARQRYYCFTMNCDGSSGRPEGQCTFKGFLPAATAPS